MTWKWLSRQAAIASHGAQIAEHGGSDDLRDEGLLESALARPLNLTACGDPDVAALAAAYAFGLARNHPFVDGARRTALVVSFGFLFLNGYDLAATEVQAVETFLRLAAGEMSEDDLAAWFRAHSRPRNR